MFAIDISRQAILLGTDRSGHAHDLTHTASRLHHANRAQCFVRDRDIATRHVQQVLDVDDTVEWVKQRQQVERSIY